VKAFLTIAFLQFLALILPGPDFAMLVQNALLYQRRIGIYTALGIALGILVHVSYCIFGLALVIAHSLTLFTTIKLLGATYLMYVGAKALLPTPVTHTRQSAVTHVSTILAGQAVKQGFFCNVLNPKAGLFFIGLFTLVVQPNTPLIAQAGYGLWMAGTTFIWFALLAFTITHSYFCTMIVRLQFWITKLMGAFLLIFGLRLLFLKFSG
jgi:threonine/homoserine/homoserine lactone efflux protein